MDKEKLRDAIPNTMAELDLPDSIPVVKGKVRDIFDLGNYLLIVTTDRISAFDRVLSTIPYKGEVLNRISLFWFKNTKDIIKNHIKEEVTPRAVLVKKCKVIPIEVVVRGYLTGSAWRDYKAGRDVSGIQLDRGMAFNEKFREPIVTPSTKSERGVHDEPVSEQTLVERGIVS
ncbi:MAG: phosphoribosylaminoimidazolesuccinocarboxamide synthase, partial [Spirochaetes bacterium]